VQVYGHRTEGPHAPEHYVVGFATVEVPVGQAARVDIPVSLLPLAVWNPQLKKRECPSGTSVELLVGAHAKDPAACRLRVPV
jgi:hypothetical protein